MIETLQAWGQHLPDWGTVWQWIVPPWVVLGIVQSAWVIMQRRSPVATIGWIIALILMPIVGLVIYRVFGPMRVQRQRLKRLLGRARLGAQQERLALREEYPDAPLWALQHTRLIEHASGIPLSTAHGVELLFDGVATLKSMLAAVRTARHHVHLEYYIYEPDQIGTQLRDALIERLRAGVEVRLLVDAVGSPKLTSRAGRRFLAEFTALGGEFAVFHPNRFDRLRPLVNLRTHRKILVVDGVVGFTGGINITEDENEEVCETAYRDTHLKLEGPVVRWLQYVFLEDWAYAVGTKAARVLARELIVTSEPGPVGVQVVASGPDTHGEAIHRSMIDALHTAERRIWLTTPYFVPTEPALYALVDAAMRGVDVKLLVPQESDSRLVTAAARSYYEELQDAGVKVFEYLPRMLHAKTLLVDDLYAQIGTANFDHRSFRLNFEVAVAIFSPQVNAELAESFERDLAHSRLVPSAKREPFPARLAQAVARLFSPVL
jgi:cardiolipin synthase